MALCVSGKLIWSNIDDAPFIHVAGRDVPGFNQVAQPLGGVRVEFVVVGSHLLLVKINISRSNAVVHLGRVLQLSLMRPLDILVDGIG